MLTRRRSRLKLFALFIGIALLALAAAAWALGRSKPEPGAFTTAGTGPHGYKAMALLYEELGYDVVSLEAPLGAVVGVATGPANARETDAGAEWSGEDPLGVDGSVLLVVSPPLAEALSAADMEAVADWVAAGNVALLPAVSQSVEAVELPNGEALTPFLLERTDAAATTPGVVATVGDGQLIVADDPTFATNRGIARGDQAAVLVEIAEGAGAREVWVAQLPSRAEISISPVFGWQGSGRLPSLDDALPLVESAIPEALEALPPMDEPLPPVGAAHLAVAVGFAVWAVSRRINPGAFRGSAVLGGARGGNTPGWVSRLGRARTNRREARGEARARRQAGPKSKPVLVPAYVAAIADRNRRAGGAARQRALAAQYRALVHAATGSEPTGSERRPTEPVELANLFAAPLRMPEKSLVKLFTRCRAALNGEAISERELVKLSKAIERCRRSLLKRSESVE